MSFLVDRTAVEPRHSLISLQHVYQNCAENPLSGITGTSRTLPLYDRLRLSCHIFSCYDHEAQAFSMAQCISKVRGRDL